MEAVDLDCPDRHPACPATDIAVLNELALLFLLLTFAPGYISILTGHLPVFIDRRSHEACRILYRLRSVRYEPLCLIDLVK